MQKRIFGLFVGTALSIFVAGGLANAGGENHGNGSSQNSGNSQNGASNRSASGTGVSVPLDIDADSCTTVSSVTVCTDSSIHSNFAGTSSAFGDFTGQDAAEYKPAPGTGCIIAGRAQPIAGCTLLGGSEQGCQFQTVNGAEVDRYKSGDLLVSTESATVCEDLSSAPPFNFTGSSNLTITGGTGQFAGASGTSTSTFQGQTLLVDPASHIFAEFVANGTESITLAGSSH